MIEKYLITRVNKVITINNSIGEELVKRYNIEFPYLIFNCPPPLTNGTVPSFKGLLRDAAGISEDKKLVLYQGGFSPSRGLEELVEAFTFLDNRYCLVFMGYGSLQVELEALVKNRSLNNRIKFIPAVPQEELLKYTSSAELGVIPYKPVSLNNYYTLPNKLFEYINANIPIVASDLPELRRVIKGYNIGHLFDPNSSRSIAEAIDFVMSDEHLYRTMKANTLNSAKAFNWDNEAEKLIDCYRMI